MTYCNEMSNTFVLIVLICIIMTVDLGISSECQVQVLDSYNYVGCFANAGDSTLPHLYKGIGYDIEMENSRCILYCKGHGYKYAGTKKGELCFCGDNAYCNGPEKPNNDCDERCSGDLTQVCGAHWRLSVYTTGYRPLNRQNNLFVEFAKDYRFAKKTRQIVRMGNGVVLGCAANCVASITCRAFEVAMETAECSLLHDYESLCEGLQQAIGYTIYTMSLIYTEDCQGYKKIREDLYGTSVACDCCCWC